MITPEEEAYLHRKAYVPEHIVSLMVPISKGEPFLKEDHLSFVKDNWVIVVGYPLDGNFSQERCERILKQAVETFRPEYLWFIGPEAPAALLGSCKERETDRYYRLDLEQIKSKPSLQRMADKTSKALTMERGHSISKEHQSLIAELLKREKLSPRVRELYRAMPDYVGSFVECIRTQCVGREWQTLCVLCGRTWGKEFFDLCPWLPFKKALCASRF